MGRRQVLSKRLLVAAFVLVFVAVGSTGVRSGVADAGVSAGHLANVLSVVSDGSGSCALLTSGSVDCWGTGKSGQLGNGIFYKRSETGHGGSAVPVQVEGVGSIGTLTGVASLATTGNGYCALLASGGVDCWGAGAFGDLGDGIFYTSGAQGSAVPVQVVGVGGTGTLTGVKSLTSGSYNEICALLTSGEVDCWGEGPYGELGDGVFYTTGDQGSAAPVQVEGVGGTGTLGGVASLISQDGGYCALLTSGGVDCWGYGAWGTLGNGVFYQSGAPGSAFPVQVEGVGGIGTLTGVASLTSATYNDFCALLTSGGVDCWGDGEVGQLGNGQFYASSSYGSATPVQVEGVGGIGNLTGVASLMSENETYCGLLTSGGVDCWGYGSSGNLGNGIIYANNDGSAVPVQVEGVGGAGTLSGVASLTGNVDNRSGSCALLTSGGVDCWGAGPFGQLGNGVFYTTGNEGFASPVQVVGVGGSGTLSGVGGLTGGEGSYCALLTHGKIDCWGAGATGQLGDGVFYTTGTKGSAVPVKVK